MPGLGISLGMPFALAAGAGGLSAATLAKASAVYGTRKLVSGYNGFAYTLVRTDAQTLNVPFLANGLADTNAAATWLGTDTGLVTTWYDQTGNGRTLTQTVAANRPYWAKRGRSGEVGAISMAITGSPRRYLNIDVGVATDGLNASVLAVQQLNDRSMHAFPSSPPVIQLGTQAPLGFSTSTVWFDTLTPDPDQADMRVQMQTSIGGTTRNTGTVTNFRPSNCAPSIYSVRSLAGAINWRLGWRTANASAGSASSGTGGTIGQAGGTSYYNPATNYYALVIASGFSDVEEANAIGELRSIYGLAIPNNLLVWDGDGITSGNESSTGYDDRMTTPCYLLRTNLGSAWEMHCVNYPGGSVTTGNARDRIYPAPDSVDSLYDATQFTGRRISVVMLGISDITSGVAAASIQAGIQTYCNARRAAGWEMIVCSILPTQTLTGPQETSRVAINAWLAANWSTFATRFADTANAVSWSAGSWLTYMQNGTLPNAAGVAAIESTVRAQI